MSLARALVALGLALAACDSGPPPYGFDTAPEQWFKVEGEHTTQIDGTPVRVESYAEMHVRSTPLEAGGATLDAYLDRYYESVQGAEIAREVSISPMGIVVTDGEQGEARLGPDDSTPTSTSVSELLERPLSSATVSSEGVVSGTPFHNYDPLLAQVTPLEWMLLALPVLSDGGDTVWHGSRELPPMGAYRLGIQLPLRYERKPGEGDNPVIRAGGSALRPGIQLSDGFTGDLELEYRGETALDEEDRLAKATAELQMTFTGQDGSRVESSHRVRIVCASCDDGINSPEPPPDQGME